MPIQSGAFERTIISGEDAKAFSQWMRYNRGNSRAKASAINGSKLAASFLRDGFVELTLKRAKAA